MNAEEKYPVLIGHSLAGRTRLHCIQEVANFICVHGQQCDLTITQRDGTPFLDTFGIYINKIADMEYREELMKLNENALKMKNQKQTEKISITEWRCEVWKTAIPIGISEIPVFW